MEIKIEKPDESRLKNLNVRSWPIWEKEASTFPWEYSDKETCYFLEGKVKVKPEEGEEVEIGKGDLVTFPQGMKCTWNILKKVKKHYTFG
ncbi:MAG: cupin domain-containing protein [Spirochaetes bacterium]|nr:cupin domain-containing protein [Spirochaetota bacterium]